MLSPYRAVLSRPGAFRFSAAGLVARLPIAMVGIGVVLMVQGVYGSYGLAGRIAAVYVLTHALCSPQLAKLVDRYGQARVMRPAIAVATLGMLGLVVAGSLASPVAWLYVGAVVTGASVGSVGALVRARWSFLLDDPRQLNTAYALESALDEVCFIVGPTLATVLATAVAPAAGLVVPAIACAVGGFALLAQTATEPPVEQRDRGVRLRSVLRNVGMAVVALVSVGLGASLGALDVAIIAFAEEHNHKGLAGLVLGVFATGSLVAGLLYGARHWLSPLWRRFVLGVLGLAVATGLLLLVGSLPVMSLVAFVVGLGIAPTLISANALVQQFVPRSRLTEGLTWAVTALGLGVAAGASIAGTMIDRQGSFGGFLVVVASAVLAALTTLVSLRALQRPAQQPVAGGREPEPQVEHLHSDQVEGAAMGAALAGADLGLGTGPGEVGGGAGHPPTDQTDRTDPIDPADPADRSRATGRSGPGQDAGGPTTETSDVGPPPVSPG